MNIMLLGGLFVCFIAIYLGNPTLKENYKTYLDFAAFALVFGGTMGASMISTRPKDFISLMSILSGWMYLKRKKLSNYQAVQVLTKISEEASRSGKNSVLEMGKGVGDGFLDRALGLMGSGLDEDFVRRSLEIDISQEKKRHSKLITMIRAMGTFAPMFGMMGTVMGVLLVLQNVTDIDSVVAGMAMALLTTLYGLLLTSLLFTPITNKLKFLNEQDALTKEIIMEGVLAVMQGQIPLKVEKLLMAYLSSSVKKKTSK